MNTCPNSSKNLPELRLDHLERYAKRWVDKFPKISIERVVLYRYNPKRQEYYEFLKTERVRTKYAIVFEVSDHVDPAEYDRLVSAMEIYCTIPRRPRFLAFIDNGFSVVYNQQPLDNFKDEWLFLPKKTGEKLEELQANIATGEAHYVLFDEDISWPAEPVCSSHPTDGVICVDSCIPKPEDQPYVDAIMRRPDGELFRCYSEEWQRETAQTAFRIGGVKLYDLAFILARENIYNEVLPDLWAWSGFNEELDNKVFPKWKPSMAENEWKRARVWFWLLWRWVIYERFGGSEERKSFYFGEIAEKCPTPRLNLYEFINGEFRLVSEGQQQRSSQYVQVFEFRKYLRSIKDSYPLPKRLFPEGLEIRLDRRRLEEMAEEEILNGFTLFENLIGYLALDEQYTDLLPSLWQKWECAVRGANEPDISTPESRAVVWQALLYRWTHGRVAGPRMSGKRLPYLALHFFNEDTGEYKRKKPDDPGENYIKLKDLEEYFIKRIKIALPCLLFPDRKSSDSQNTEVVDIGAIPDKRLESKLSDSIQESNPDIKEHDNVLCRMNETWFVKFLGDSTTFRDRESLRYIVHLLEKPDMRIHVIDLFNAVKGGAPDIISVRYGPHSEKQISVNQMEDNGNEKFLEKMSLSDLEIEELTDKDKESLEGTGYDLLNEVIEAEKSGDFRVLQEKKTNLAKYRRHLLNEYGVKTIVSGDKIGFKKIYRSSPEVEKARNNVKNQISIAIRVISKGMPTLGEHLQKSIRKGEYCIYKPDPQNHIEWYITW